jgi:phosphoribosyl 1,2-cyclic phosphodiesterase
LSAPGLRRLRSVQNSRGPIRRLRVSVLGSGSSGNSTLVWAGNTRVLVDAGFSGKDLVRRLQVLEVEPDDIHGIVVTHEHGDHIRGIGIFARRYGTPLYMTEPTRDACSKMLKGTETVHIYRPGRPFNLGDIRVEPFLTVHDAVDPVGLALVDECTGLRLGVATDLGRPTAQIRHALAVCDLLILESNHDEVLLHTSDYPPSVRRRIASSHGHLSNQAAARFAVELLHPRLAGVVLAHLSRECNRPALAAEVVGAALKHAGWTGHLEVAGQDNPTSLLDVEELRYLSGPNQLSLL